MSIEELSSRELQVWKYVSQLLPFSEMAKKMGIGSTTVCVHFVCLCRKLDISTKFGAGSYVQLYNLAQEWMSK